MGQHRASRECGPLGRAIGHTQSPKTSNPLKGVFPKWWIPRIAKLCHQNATSALYPHTNRASSRKLRSPQSFGRQSLYCSRDVSERQVDSTGQTPNFPRSGQIGKCDPTGCSLVISRLSRVPSPGSVAPNALPLTLSDAWGTRAGFQQ